MRVLVVLLALLAGAGAQERLPEKWADWRPFLGTWEGAGGGGPGQGSGGFTFTPELQGAVLVRHSYAQYPATKDKPAYRHDDLMVIYPVPSGKKTRADYWDNEGHVIHYVVEFRPQAGDGERSRAARAALPPDLRENRRQRSEAHVRNRAAGGAGEIQDLH
jgi:hypothetical protein